MGIGITFPIQLGKTGYFAQSQTALEATKTNLISLLLTRKGERPFEPELGSDLHSLVFAQMDTEYEANVKSAIDRAVAQWLPFVIVVDQQVRRDVDRNLTMVKVSFALTSNPLITDAVVVEF